MTETEFARLAADTLAKIETGLERSGADLDFELGGGVLEVEFADGAKLIVNAHGAAQEIWVAAKSGGFHFRFDDGHWRDTRSGEDLKAALTRLVNLHLGAPIELA